VHRGNDPARPIGHEQRNTIGHANGHRDIGTVRDEGIRFRSHCGQCVAIAHHHDRPSVHLLRHGHAPRANCRRQSIGVRGRRQRELPRRE
jgi:hypothetical protein